MQNYEIKQDFIEQRTIYLQYLLSITAIGGIILFAANQVLSKNGYLPAWVAVFGACIIATIFHNKKRINVSTWIYLLGIVLALTIYLFNFGPNLLVHFLITLPIVFALLLLDRQQVIWFTGIVIACMIVVTFLYDRSFSSLSQLLFPILYAGILGFVAYIKEGNVHEMVYWATDIQQKDQRRAETFFAQKEELSNTLLQLTHAHSRLELLNQQLEQAQHHAEQASQAKSVFLSNMSHELRTPLNVIIGYTSSMLDMPEVYDDISLTPAYRRDIELIKGSGYYLLGLINDILDLSKIEAGKLELHAGPVDLVKEFQGILATSIGLVKDKPLQVRPDFPEDLPVVWADAIRVRQIVLNLMSNAIKFTQTGSVTLHARANGNTVSISIIDTGIGIPEKAIAHIFDRFEQAERDTDRRYGGTGLGLDISKQLAQMHGGDLVVQSIVGQGSTFTFTLTVATPEQIAQTPTLKSTESAISETSVSGTPTLYTILLVEDETHERDMMRRALESAEYVVVDIPDGNQILDMAVGLLPDLILLDIKLPNTSGWDVLRDLKANVDTSQIPIIVCTGSEDEQQAYQLGANYYINKPFSGDELLTRVQTVLAKSLQINKEEVK
jgi:signal transduction histidine kinase/ActR/RegA family two-component response regulator